jgi:hypothetical protein
MFLSLRISTRQHLLNETMIKGCSGLELILAINASRMNHGQYIWPLRNFTMKNIIVIVFLISYVEVAAQIIHPDSIAGEWICRKAVALEELEGSPQEKEMMQAIIKGFENARFVFGSNGIFMLHVSKDAPEQLRELDFLNNQKWFYYPEENKISIGTRQQNLMHIIVRREEGMVTFLLFETPLSMRMEKI